MAPPPIYGSRAGLGDISESEPSKWVGFLSLRKEHWSTLIGIGDLWRSMRKGSQRVIRWMRVDRNRIDRCFGGWRKIPLEI